MHGHYLLWLTLIRLYPNHPINFLIIIDHDKELLYAEDIDRGKQGM